MFIELDKTDTLHYYIYYTSLYHTGTYFIIQLVNMVIILV